MTFFATPLRLFRVVAIAEAVTWTLLIAGLILRATLGLDLAVSVAGGAHGFVFLAYAATAILVAVNQRWSPGVAALAIVSAAIPYATIPVERWLERSDRLDGQWRREASDDPRDAGRFDRLVRWMLRHPVLLLVLLAAAVVAVFAVLLLVGPPGGKN